MNYNLTMKTIFLSTFLLLWIPVLCLGQNSSEPEKFDYFYSDWETIGRLTLNPDHTFHIASRTGLIRNETIGRWTEVGNDIWIVPNPVDTTQARMETTFEPWSKDSVVFRFMRMDSLPIEGSAFVVEEYEGELNSYPLSMVSTIRATQTGLKEVHFFGMEGRFTMEKDRGENGEGFEKGIYTVIMPSFHSDFMDYILFDSWKLKRKGKRLVALERHPVMGKPKFRPGEGEVEW